MEMEQQSKIVFIVIAALCVVVVITFAILIPLVFLKDDDDNNVAATMTTVMTTVTTAISNVFYDAVFIYPVPYQSDFATPGTALYIGLATNITATIQAFLVSNSLTTAVPSHTVQGFAATGNAAETQVTVRVETDPGQVDKATLQALLTAQLPSVVTGASLVALNDV